MWPLIERRVRRPRLVVLAVFCVGALAMLGLVMPDAEGDGTWVPVQAQALSEQVSFSAPLQPVRLMEIASPVEGQLTRLNVAWGDAVQPGQVLARLTSSDLSTRIREAQVALLRGQNEMQGMAEPSSSPEYLAAVRRERAAQDELDNAKKRLAETQALYDKGYVARMELDQATRELVAAERRIDETAEETRAVLGKWAKPLRHARQLEAAVREAKYQELRELDDRLTLRSPIAGIAMPAPRPQASERAVPTEVRQGAYLGAREAVMMIGDTSALLVRGCVGEAEMRWLRQGLPARIFVQSLGQTPLQGRVMRVAAQARLQGAAAGGAAEFEVQVQVPAPGESLPAGVAERLFLGSIVRVEVSQSAAKPALMVPLQSIRWSHEGVPAVRRRVASGAVQDVTVEIVRTQAELAYVLGELQVGDEVWQTGQPAAAAEARPSGLLGRLFGGGAEE